MSDIPKDLYMMEHAELNEEFSRLNFLLGKERTKCSDAETKVLRLSKELEEMRLQLEKEKSLKKTNSNRCKEKQRKDNKVRDEHLPTALQKQKERNRHLTEELNSNQSSYQELKVKFENDVLAAKQRIDKLKQELEAEKKSHVDKTSENQRLLDEQRSELEALRQKMVQEKTSLQKTSQEKRNRLQKELDELKAANQELSSRYEEDIVKIRQEVETLQQHCNKQVIENQKIIIKNQQLIKYMKDDKDVIYEAMTQELQALKQACIEKEMRFHQRLDNLKAQLEKNMEDELLKEIALEEANKRPSFWKRFKCFFGSKKSERRQKDKSSPSERA